MGGNIVLLYYMIKKVTLLFCEEKQNGKSMLLGKNECAKSIKKGNDPYMQRYEVPSFRNL